MWKSRLLFILVLIFSVTFAVTYMDTSIGLSLIYALFFMFICSLVSILFSFFFVSIKESVNTDTLIKKEKLIYTISIKNRGVFFYPNVKKEYFANDVFDYKLGKLNKSYLGARGELVENYELEFPYRGVYKIGLKRVTIVDFLGLFSAKINMKTPTYITVFPSYDSDVLVASFGQRSSKNRKLFNEDISSLSEIRKYMFSDSLKKIHWKLTAKRGELMVKDYNTFEKDKTVLFLDTSIIAIQGNYRLKFEDHMISYVAAGIDNCVRNSVLATLIYGDQDTDRVDIQETYEVNRIFKMLAEIKFDKNQDDFNSIPNLELAQSYVLFLSNMSEEIYKSVLLLSTDDNMITLFYFYFDPISDGIKNYLDRLRISGIMVNEIHV